MESNTSKLVLAFFTLILGIVLIGSVADTSSLVTTKVTVTNETLDISDAVYGETGTINASVALTITNYPSGWKTGDCPITSFVMRNQTGETLTVTTDYVFTASAGTLTLEDTLSLNETSGVSNDTYIDYVYCGDDYLNLAWGRTVLSLVAGFFALALLGASLALFYDVARDTGIISK